jgi:serine-type anaerobic sulfatase-maturating enzyme
LTEWICDTRLLQEHQVDFNILTTVNTANDVHLLEAYRFLRDEVSTNFMQFIPTVEHINEQG